ncbi:MAG: glycosyltransferase, partial [Chthonomonadaceae bacterium]|nr:glycosyltransferase [Chthonomonadaceae bacterium]
MISHTAMSPDAGQPKLHHIAADDTIELTVLVPDCMNFYGTWERAEPPKEARFRFVVGRARWQRVAGQWYLQHYPGALSALLRQFHPDVVDIWQEPWSLVCAQAVWLTRRLCPNARILVETEQNLYKHLPPPFQQFQSYVLHRTHFLIGRSQEAIQVARRKGYMGPAEVVPNGVDCDLFRPVQEEKRIGPAERFVMGFVGRLVSEKGVYDLLQSLTHLPERVHLLCIGDGPERPALEGEVRRLRLESRVLFTGSLPYRQLPEWIHRMDALVLPSHTTPRWKEQFGRVLIEAGACGKPVIGSSSGAIPEVVA